MSFNPQYIINTLIKFYFFFIVSLSTVIAQENSDGSFLSFKDSIEQLIKSNQYEKGFMLLNDASYNYRFPDHDKWLFYNLGFTSFKLSKKDIAHGYFIESLSIQNGEIATTDSLYFNTNLYKGSCEITLGEYQTAVQTFQNTLLVLKDVVSKNVKLETELKNGLGRAYTELGEYIKADSVFNATKEFIINNLRTRKIIIRS